MIEPRLVEGAMFSPGHCHICGGSQGAMVDTGVDVPGDGRTYICLKVCVPLIARACRWLTPEQGDQLLERLGQATAEANELRDALERERDNRVVSLEDVLRLTGQAREPAGAISEGGL